MLESGGRGVVYFKKIFIFNSSVRKDNMYEMVAGYVGVEKKTTRTT